MHASLDGFVQGTNDWDIGWVTFNEDLENYAEETLRTVDTVLWGRSTYQGMQQYWTSVPNNPEASDYEKRHAAWVNNALKVVVSTTLDNADWNNSMLIKDNIEGEITKLKQQTGGDIVILGSPRLAHSLMRDGLIDEFRINVNPVSLGEGLPIFKDLKERINLELVSNKTFAGGVAGLVYRLKK
jgi:dihydrofolate reductase